MRSSFRRTFAAFAVWVVAFVAVLSIGNDAASGQTEFNPGLGTAIARLVKIDPKLGGLSFGITSGLAIAGHQNTVAQADSRAVDLGVIGTTLSGEGCDGGDPTLAKDQQPRAVVVRSDAQGAAAGESSDEIPTIHQFARASERPFAEATTTMLPYGVTGVLEVGSGVATSTSGVTKDGVREARATTEFSKMIFAGGAVSLNGIRWEAVHRSGGEKASEGEFAIDQLAVAGVPVPASSASSALNQANAALGLLGFEIVAPEVRIVEDVVFVDPMRVAIIPATVRDDLLGPLFETAQPLRQQLFDQILAIDCGNSTYVTVADIALGTVTAAGSMAFEFGGVQAGTSEIDFFRFASSGGVGAPVAPAVPPGLDQPAPLLSNAGDDTIAETTPARDTPASVMPSTPAAEDAVLPATPAASSGTRGGAMAAVAGSGLLLIGGVAEGDRRKMRRAQREIPMVFE